MALNITVEKVLKRSKRPNTALGIKPLPIAPIVIVSKAIKLQQFANVLYPLKIDPVPYGLIPNKGILIFERFEQL